jgi:hypothetical protein
MQEGVGSMRRETLEDKGGESKGQNMVAAGGSFVIHSREDCHREEAYMF